jgi:drug/metabolite transporter (DMT)-like permease
MVAPMSRLVAGGERRWSRLSLRLRGAMLVSTGALCLVVMAILTKELGERMSSFQILFFRSFIGFLFLAPLFVRDPAQPFRTTRLGLHFLRGAVGTAGNICFFWTITHMLLADSMALQFSRPLFMIPLAMLFLGEAVGTRRSLITLLGFAGILLYARPFTAEFDPNALVGALGALLGALVILFIKRLAATEPTRVIMFYYAFWNAALAAIPAFFLWVPPTWTDMGLLVLVAAFGMGGQAMMTHGLSMGDATALLPLDYSRVVYAALLGFLIFGEVPGAWSMLGMLLIVGSSIILMWSERSRAPPST